MFLGQFSPYVDKNPGFHKRLSQRPVLSEPYSVILYSPNLNPFALSFYKTPRDRVYCTLPRHRLAKREITA